MQALFEQVQHLTIGMHEAMDTGRTKDFSRLQNQRHSLLKNIAAAKRPLTPEEKVLIDTIQKQDITWRQYIRSSLTSLRHKINKSQHKRHSLGNISKAYVGNQGAGRFVYRRG